MYNEANNAYLRYSTATVHPNDETCGRTALPNDPFGTTKFPRLPWCAGRSSGTQPGPSRLNIIFNRFLNSADVEVLGLLELVSARWTKVFVSAAEAPSSENGCPK